jgi:hypothetical protein
VLVRLVEKVEEWKWNPFWRWMPPTNQPVDPDLALWFPWLIYRSPKWVHRVNEISSEKELATIRQPTHTSKIAGIRAASVFLFENHPGFCKVDLSCEFIIEE